MVPRWLGRLSWLKIALVFHATWEASDRSVEHANAWGLERRTMTGIKIIAVDEVRSERGHHCITLVHQINAGAKRLLGIGFDRTESADFFETLTVDELKNSIRDLCSDMWKPLLNALAQETSSMVHVLSRFHIMQTMNKPIDEMRTEETRRLKGDDYEPALKRAR
jgi:transposase